MLPKQHIIRHTIFGHKEKQWIILLQEHGMDHIALKTAGSRNYDNSFRSSFHYLTGISDIKQSHETLTRNPFTSSEII